MTCSRYARRYGPWVLAFPGLRGIREDSARPAGSSSPGSAGSSCPADSCAPASCSPDSESSAGGAAVSSSAGSSCASSRRALGAAAGAASGAAWAAVALRRRRAGAGVRAASFSPSPAAGADEDAEDVVGGVIVHSPGAASPAVPADARRDRAPGCGSTEVCVCAWRRRPPASSARAGTAAALEAAQGSRTRRASRFGHRGRYVAPGAAASIPHPPRAFRSHAPHGGSPIVVGGRAAAGAAPRRRPRRTVFVTRRQTRRILRLSVHPR